MKFENQNDRDAETLSDLALTTDEGNEVTAGTIGVDSGTQLTIQGQVSGSAAGGGGAGKCQVQDFHFVAKF